MSITNYTFQSSDDTHTTIHAVKWLPAGDPVAVMQLTHGMQEYIERYSEFAQYLTDKGFAVWTQISAVRTAALSGRQNDTDSPVNTYKNSSFL